MGDIVLTCDRRGDPPLGLSAVGISLSVSLNVNVTNNVNFLGDDSFTDAVLTVQETNCTVPSTSAASSTCESGESGFQNPVFGELTANNRLTWNTVFLPVPGGENFPGGTFPEIITMRITGIRANVSQLDVPGSVPFPGEQVTATVSVAAPVVIPVANEVLNVGVPVPGTSTIVSWAVDDEFGINVAEHFPGVFLSEGSPSFLPAERRSESGYFAPGSNNGGGASSGTRLLIRFFDVPDGTEISLPSQIEYGLPQLEGDALHLSLVPDADSDGQGGTPTGGSGQHGVGIEDGFGRAVYEVMDADPGALESVVIPGTFEAGSNGGAVLVGLAPLSTVTNASETEAEPRFGDGGGDPAIIATAPAAVTPVAVQLMSIPVDDGGQFMVSVGGAQVIDGPAGAYGSTDVSRGANVPVSVSASTGTVILDYETKITCVGGGLTQPATASFPDTAPAPRTLSLPVPSAGGAPVQCSVLNRNTADDPTLTSVDFTQMVLPDFDLGMFEILADGTAASSGGNGVVGTVDVEQGAAFVVEQTGLPGTTLADYGTLITCSGGGLLGTATASFSPGDTQARSLTFDVPPGNGSRMHCDVRSELAAVPSPPTVAPTSQTTCVATSVPGPIRAEGIAELTEDIVLACISSWSPSASHFVGNVTVSFNTNVTNNIDFGEGPSMTDAVLVINENNCETPSAVGSNLGCGPDDRFQAPQYGELVGKNRLEWRNVSFPIPGGPSGQGQSNPFATTVRITNLRVRAEELGIPNSPTPPYSPVMASISVSGATIPLNTTVVNVAAPVVGLITALNPGEGGDMNLTLEEGFASAFKTQGFASFTTGTQNSEAGYYTPGSNGGNGAVSGTRFLVRFVGLDEGAAVSVPRQVDAGSTATTGDGLHLALVSGHDSNGAGGSVDLLTGLQAVPLSGGAGLAVYEVLDSAPFDLEQIVVPISFDSGSLGSGLINAHLGPASMETEASATAPEVRFREFPVGPLPPVGPVITNPAISFPQGASPGLPAVVTANIEDADSSVSSAFVTVRNLLGTFSQDFPMTSTGGTLFEAPIDTSFYSDLSYEVTITAADSGSPQGWRSLPNVLRLWLSCWAHTDPFNLNTVFPHGGGTGSFDIVAPGTCGWYLTSPSWISTEIVGEARVDYVVAENRDAAPRQGDVSLYLEHPYWLPQPSPSWLFGVGQLGAPPIEPDSAGIYSEGSWFLDANGNGNPDNIIDRSFSLGFPGAQPFVGDWNGDGKDEAGVYKDGFWFLDFNGDDIWDGGAVDKVFAFGWIGATPVTGDWNGDGATDVGVYNNGFWFLDADGDRLWDGGVNDAQFGFGWPGVEIQIGDWNGDGRDKVGVFSNGFWFLDYDGDTLWDGGTADRLFGWGWAGVTPIIGDWNGDGRDKAGAWVNGFWLLDYDGDNLWDGGTTDRLYGWGASTATPVIGDWDGDGADSAGAFLDGEWVLDVNGDALWDGGTVDQLFNWGTAGDTPVVGRW